MKTSGWVQEIPPLVSTQDLCGRDNWIIASAVRTNTRISSVTAGARVTRTCRRGGQFRTSPIPSCFLAEATARRCFGTLRGPGAQAQTHGCLRFKPKYPAVSQSGRSPARCPPWHEGAALGKGQGRQIAPIIVSTATAGFTKALLSCSLSWLMPSKALWHSSCKRKTNTVTPTLSQQLHGGGNGPLLRRSQRTGARQQPSATAARSAARSSAQAELLTDLP